MKKNKKYNFYGQYVFFSSLAILLLMAFMAWDIEKHQKLLNYIFLIGSSWAGIRVVKYCQEKKWPLAFLFSTGGIALLAMLVMRVLEVTL